MDEEILFVHTKIYDATAFNYCQAFKSNGEMCCKEIDCDEKFCEVHEEEEQKK